MLVKTPGAKLKGPWFPSIPKLYQAGLIMPRLSRLSRQVLKIIHGSITSNHQSYPMTLPRSNKNLWTNQAKNRWKEHLWSIMILWKSSEPVLQVAPIFRPGRAERPMAAAPRGRPGGRPGSPGSPGVSWPKIGTRCHWYPQKVARLRWQLIWIDLDGLVDGLWWSSWWSMMTAGGTKCHRLTDLDGLWWSSAENEMGVSKIWAPFLVGPCCLNMWEEIEHSFPNGEYIGGLLRYIAWVLRHTHISKWATSLGLFSFEHDPYSKDLSKFSNVFLAVQHVQPMFIFSTLKCVRNVCCWISWSLAENRSTAWMCKPPEEHKVPFIHLWQHG